MPHSYCLELAGQRLCCSFQFLGTSRYFREYVVDCSCDTEPVCLAQEEIAVFRGCNPGMPWNPYAEYKAFLGRIGDELLSKEILMLHCVAFVWQGKAWLLSAPSGTGKTTQFKNLKQLYGDEVQILCGDNPFLRFSHEGVTVYPSPWNGKENYRSGLIAPLGGIVLLKQAGYNHISPITPSDAAVPVLLETNSYCRSKEKLHMLIQLEERLLQLVPLWQMENLGDLASSELLLQTLGS